jgi:hypothetical protein
MRRRQGIYSDQALASAKSTTCEHVHHPVQPWSCGTPTIFVFTIIIIILLINFMTVHVSVDQSKVLEHVDQNAQGWKIFCSQATHTPNEVDHNIGRSSWYSFGASFLKETSNSHGNHPSDNMLPFVHQQNDLYTMCVHNTQLFGASQSWITYYTLIFSRSISGLLLTRYTATDFFENTALSSVHYWTEQGFMEPTALYLTLVRLLSKITFLVLTLRDELIRLNFLLQLGFLLVMVLGGMHLFRTLVASFFSPLDLTTGNALDMQKQNGIYYQNLPRQTLVNSMKSSGPFLSSEHQNRLPWRSDFVVPANSAIFMPRSPVWKESIIDNKFPGEELEQSGDICDEVEDFDETSSIGQSVMALPLQETAQTVAARSMFHHMSRINDDVSETMLRIFPNRN